MRHTKVEWRGGLVDVEGTEEGDNDTCQERCTGCPDFCHVSFSCGWFKQRDESRGVGCISLLSQGQITASLHPRHRIMFTGCRVTVVLRANHLARDNIKCYQPLYLLARYLPC